MSRSETVRRHTFLAESSTSTIDLTLNEVLTNVFRIQISWVQVPAINTNFDDFVYIVEFDPNGQLEANGSSNIGGMVGNPPRCFLTLPQASTSVTTNYLYGNYVIDKQYANQFTLSTVRLRLVNRNGDAVTFQAGAPDFGVFFVVWCKD